MCPGLRPLQFKREIIPRRINIRRTGRLSILVSSKKYYRKSVVIPHSCTTRSNPYFNRQSKNCVDRPDVAVSHAELVSASLVSTRSWDKPVLHLIQHLGWPGCGWTRFLSHYHARGLPDQSIRVQALSGIPRDCHSRGSLSGIHEKGLPFHFCPS
jgi:hypothetical protein